MNSFRGTTLIHDHERSCTPYLCNGIARSVYYQFNRELQGEFKVLICRFSPASGSLKDWDLLLLLIIAMIEYAVFLSKLHSFYHFYRSCQVKSSKISYSHRKNRMEAAVQTAARAIMTNSGSRTSPAGKPKAAAFISLIP